MSRDVVSTSNNGQTETKIYDDGKLVSIQHKDEDTGKTHEHEANRGGLLGVFGPYTGKEK